ncbi:hypothetical protein [Embleya sp. AB8]|uniref:hypothetical protein n=1 Tax=Embleya sp. AB8 TaxID=3156304 RepID=UPI003C72EC8D
MRTGRVVADPREPACLRPDAAPAYLGDLVAAKREAEHGALPGMVPIDVVWADVERLRATPDEVYEVSALAERPDAHDAPHVEPGRRDGVLGNHDGATACFPDPRPSANAGSTPRGSRPRTLLDRAPAGTELTRAALLRGRMSPPREGRRGPQEPRTRAVNIPAGPWGAQLF